jgi:hypothetical protein
VLEYRFLNEKFSKNREKSPAKSVLYIGIIYGNSFLIRTALNATAWLHPKTLIHVQFAGCDGNLLLFFVSIFSVKSFL